MTPLHNQGSAITTSSGLGWAAQNKAVRVKRGWKSQALKPLSLLHGLCFQEAQAEFLGPVGRY